MKTILLILLAGITFYSFVPKQDEKDWNTCVEKYKATWGDPCMSCTYNPDIFHVFFKNKCDESIDLLVAVQESTKKWECYFFEKMNPQDTAVAFACKGTGKYLYWVRKAGNREIEFPNCDEINATYNK